MVNSRNLTIATDGELWTSNNFTAGETFRYGTLEFIADCFGSLDISDGGNVPRAVFVGMTRSEPDSLHTILENVEDEDITASDEGGSHPRYGSVTWLHHPCPIPVSPHLRACRRSCQLQRPR